MSTRVSLGLGGSAGGERIGRERGEMGSGYILFVVGKMCYSGTYLSACLGMICSLSSELGASLNTEGVSDNVVIYRPVSYTEVKSSYTGVICIQLLNRPARTYSLDAPELQSKYSGGTGC